MTREWFSFRLSRPDRTDHDDYPAEAISDLVPALVRHLRTADPEGCWQFQRRPDPPGWSLDVRFHTTPPVGDELAYRLQLQSTRHGWPVHPIPARPPAAGAADPAAGLVERLSVLSSDLALDLLGSGDLDPGGQLDAAARHLLFLTGLVPAGDRPAFLFLCWQHWSRPLTPHQRVELVEQADKQATELLRRTTGTDPDQGYRWDRYFESLRGLLDPGPADPALPVNYLLFDHAHLTHNRLGIPAGTEALAARALRTALRGDAAGQ